MQLAPFTLPATLVWKVFPFQVSRLQVELPSDRSTTALPSAALNLTLLGEPSVVMKIPVLKLPFTVFLSAVLLGDSISIPLKLLLRAL